MNDPRATYNRPKDVVVNQVGRRPANNVTTPEGKVTFFVKNNLAFTIFVFMFISLLPFIFLGFVRAWSAAVNAYLLGKFKRPLPQHPELYFDVNCINTMKKEDFLNTNQVQRCYLARPIDRPGPPRQA